MIVRLVFLGIVAALAAGCRSEVTSQDGAGGEARPSGAAPTPVARPSAVPRPKRQKLGGAADAAERQAVAPAKVKQDRPASSDEPREAVAEDNKLSGVPAVTLSEQHRRALKVGVGDTLPTITVVRSGGEPVGLSSLFGKSATVVVFFADSNRRFSTEALDDLRYLVQAPYEKRGVAVVGVQVGGQAEALEALMAKTGATYPLALDPEGMGFQKIAASSDYPMPQTYVVDAKGKILWLDIEYSRATRRKLVQTIRESLK